jgi:Lon protease-like protein
VDLELEVPSSVPVMTLTGAVLFPQVMMPLHIFEPRYRQMLADVLDGQRVFAVARLDEGAACDPSRDEPPHEIATVGIVRASHQNPDGTSDLVLQGLVRVRILSIVQETPYRRVSVQPLPPVPGTIGAMVVRRLRRQIFALLRRRRDLGAGLPEQVEDFLRTVTDPETFIDLAAYSLLGDGHLQQQLLETLEVEARYHRFITHLIFANESLKTRRQLQGSLPDDRIPWN